MSVKAVIDVGTNSIKLLVVKSGVDGATALADRNEIVRLGEGVAKSGRFLDEAMIRASAVVTEMAEEARALGADEILAVATQAAREAGNSSSFTALVADKCGVAIKIISGDEEADLSFMAAVSSLGEIPPGSVICAFDIGGGSSEIMLGDGSGCSFRRSLPVGALSLHNEIFAGFVGAVPQSVLDAAGERVCEEFKRVAWEFPNGGEAVFAGTGGTITTLCAVALALEPYDPGAATGSSLEAREIDRQIELYAATNVKDRAGIIGLNPKRADIILAGACIARELMKFRRAASLTVIDRGLRYGVMEKYFGLTPSGF
jgi:exopolyphosphatase/guanosine-5'-triphosphate,3'-diphosphate pyrophosphatase